MHLHVACDRLNIVLDYFVSDERITDTRELATRFVRTTAPSYMVRIVNVGATSTSPADFRSLMSLRGGPLVSLVHAFICDLLNLGNAMKEPKELIEVYKK